jgi:hypothetical protein
MHSAPTAALLGAGSVVALLELAALVAVGYAVVVVAVAVREDRRRLNAALSAPLSGPGAGLVAGE